MLAKGTSDPYTRFITPDEFESMRKYDVTGVGLHLGTAEEYVRKTGLQLPPGHQESEVVALCTCVQNLGCMGGGGGCKAGCVPQLVADCYSDRLPGGQSTTIYSQLAEPPANTLSS